MLTKQYWKSVHKSRSDRDRVHVVILEESSEQTICGYYLANMNYEEVGTTSGSWGGAKLCSRCKKSLSAYRGQGLKNFKQDKEVEPNEHIPEKHKKKIESALKKAKEKSVKIDTFVKELEKEEAVPTPELIQPKSENPALEGLLCVLPGFKEAVSNTLKILCDELKYNHNNSLDTKCFIQIQTLKKLLSTLQETEQI